MKRANTRNFIIIAFIFIIFYIGHYFLVENNYLNLVYFDLPFHYDLLITMGVYIVFLLGSVFFVTTQVFKKYIKHLKNVKLVRSQFILAIASIFVAGTFLVFNIQYYFYFSSIVIAFLFYFGFLYIFDLNYVRKSTKNRITINDSLVDELLIILGGKENIINVTYDASRLKVECVDIKKVDLEKFKAIGASGLFVAGNKLQAIIGNNASDLEQAIKRYLSIV